MSERHFEIMNKPWEAQGKFHMVQVPVLCVFVKKDAVSHNFALLWQVCPLCFKHEWSSSLPHCTLLIWVWQYVSLLMCAPRSIKNKENCDQNGIQIGIPLSLFPFIYSKSAFWYRMKIEKYRNTNIYNIITHRKRHSQKFEWTCKSLFMQKIDETTANEIDQQN